MSDLMRSLYEYIQNHRIFAFIDLQTHAEIEHLKERNLSALKKDLSAGQLAALERYLAACQEQDSLNLEAMFLAAFSAARELGV